MVANIPLAGREHDSEEEEAFTLVSPEDQVCASKLGIGFICEDSDDE